MSDHTERAAAQLCSRRTKSGERRGKVHVQRADNVARCGLSTSLSWLGRESEIQCKPCLLSLWDEQERSR